MRQFSKRTQESGGCGRGPELGLKLLTTNLVHLKVSKAITLKLTFVFISVPNARLLFYRLLVGFSCMLNDMGPAEQQAAGFCCLILSLNSNGIHWWRLKQIFIAAQRQVLIVPVCWLNGSVAFLVFF